MDMKIFEILVMFVASLLTAIVGVVWNKADKAEKLSEGNKVILEHLAKSYEKTADLTERLSSLEASFSVEIKNLSMSVKRLESAILRINQNGHNRSY